MYQSLRKPYTGCQFVSLKAVATSTSHSEGGAAV